MLKINSLWCSSLCGSSLQVVAVKHHTPVDKEILEEVAKNMDLVYLPDLLPPYVFYLLFVNRDIADYARQLNITQY